MLSSLPTELIREIIESAVPHTFHTNTYRDRQTTLRALSLVSKLFRSIAQPLLFEIVRLETDEDFTLLNPRQVAPSSKEVILGYYVDIGALEKMPPSFHGLQALTIHSDSDRVLKLEYLCYLPSECDQSGYRKGKADLVSFTDLMKLQLTGDSFVLDSPQPLASLRSLSVDYLAVDKVHILLDPLFVPSLSALGLNLLTDWEELEALKTSQISKLLPQLDSLFVDSRLYVVAEATLLANLSPRTLVDVRASSLTLHSSTLSTVNHLRIRCSNPSEQYSRDIDEIFSFIESGGHHLRSIYLDTSFEPQQSRPTLFSRAFAKAMDACERRNIAMIFEPRAAKYDIDFYISEEFRMRRRRERIEREGGLK